MIILGLDPGIARTGYGVIDTNESNLYLRSGCLTTPSHDSPSTRLLTLGNDLKQLVAEVRPDQAVVEEIFFGANAKTAMLTAQARGVLLYVLRQAHIPTTNLTPLQIKSRLLGFGGADKQQIQHHITSRLGLSALPQPDDAADALAAALCLTK